MSRVMTPGLLVAVGSAGSNGAMTGTTIVGVLAVVSGSAGFREKGANFSSPRGVAWNICDQVRWNTLGRGECWMGVSLPPACVCYLGAFP